MVFTDICPSTWRELQDYVALFLNQAGYTATSPRTIDTARGKVEVDVFVESPDELVKKIICECKYWNTPVPKEKVHAFRAVVQDSGASIGLLISKVGFQSGTIEAANYSNVQLVTWQQFTDIISNRWIVARLKEIKRKSAPLSVYTDPLDFPHEKIRAQDVSRYDLACKKYIALRATCWMISKTDLVSDNFTVGGDGSFYQIEDYSSITSYLNFLLQAVDTAILEFN
ncbi:MAG: restriction endonuclease, partial [Ruthenibacterium sp.]